MIVEISWLLWLSIEDVKTCLCVSTCVEVCEQFKNVGFTIFRRSLQRNDMGLFVALYRLSIFFSSTTLDLTLYVGIAMRQYVISLFKKAFEKSPFGLFSYFPAFCVSYLLRLDFYCMNPLIPKRMRCHFIKCLRSCSRFWFWHYQQTPLLIVLVDFRLLQSGASAIRIATSPFRFLSLHTS